MRPAEVLHQSQRPHQQQPLATKNAEASSASEHTNHRRTVPKAPQVDQPLFRSRIFWLNARRNRFSDSSSKSDTSNRLSINASAEPSNTRSTRSPSIRPETSA